MNKTQFLGAYKSGGVVVFYSLGISKCLQDRVCLQKLLLQLALVRNKRARTVDYNFFFFLIK